MRYTIKLATKTAAILLAPLAFGVAHAAESTGATGATGEEPAAATSVPAPTIDSNSDGKADAWDRDANGAADAWDTNADGKPDQYDNDGDGKPDAARAAPER